jgi:hypothetical protein
MSEATQIGPDELLRLRPSNFLAERGCLDAAGNPREDLSGNFATAASTTFESAELSPQELQTIYEAIKQCLEIVDDPDRKVKLQQAVDEAFTISADLLGKKINPALVAWIREWIPFIHSEACIAAFMRHLSAVVQQYTLIISLKHDN